jgi:ABC-2 type transport system permease protein
VLRPYLAILSARFQLVLQYRAAALAGFVTQCWWGAMNVMVFAAFFAGARGGHTPMSFGQTISYVWLGQAFLMFLPWYADPEIADMVRTGAVAYERLRPVDPWSWWFVRALAWTCARIAPRALLMFAAAGVVMPLLGLGRWGLRLPADPTSGTLFLASILATALLSATMTVILNVVVVATLTDRGVNTLAAPISIVLSGSLIPLSYYPVAVAGVMRLSPFAGLMDTPFRIWTGTVGGAAALAALGLQVAWILAIALFGRWAIARVMGRIQVQGG